MIEPVKNEPAWALVVTAAALAALTPRKKVRLEMEAMVRFPLDER